MTFRLWSGASCILFPERPTPQSTFDVIERFRPSIYFGVPTLYASQLKEIKSATDSSPAIPDLSSIRISVSAGEALPADILRRWKEHTKTDILDGIGSTEALHIFISNRPDDIREGSSGLIVPGYDVKIVDENRSGNFQNLYCQNNKNRHDKMTKMGRNKKVDILKIHHFTKLTNT